MEKYSLDGMPLIDYYKNRNRGREKAVDSSLYGGAIFCRYIAKTAK